MLSSRQTVSYVAYSYLAYCRTFLHKIVTTIKSWMHLVLVVKDVG
jgi:hypothetical protein